MRKTHNKGGDPCLSIKTDHCVSAKHFAYALAHHCWIEGLSFDPKLSKKEAMGILKDMLYHHGINGETDFTMYEGASAEAVAGFEDNYPLAMEWVQKNYPYLNS